jgi:hypothetical protein
MRVQEEFGSGQTNSKDCSVTDNVKTLWQELTKWLDENDKNDNIKALNYNNMWNPGMPMTQHDPNLRAIYLFIVVWVE